MSGDAFWKCFVFAAFASVFVLLDSPSAATFGGLMCLIFAIDGAAKAIIAARDKERGA